MIQAIIYESNTGATADYAQLLSKHLGVNAYPNGAKEVTPNTEVIFMGWLMAGRIKGLKKAQKRYRIQAVIAVGMGPAQADQAQGIIANSPVPGAKSFYLRGGYNPAKLMGLNKLIMKMVTTEVSKNIEKQADRTAEDNAALIFFKSGGSFVADAKLDSIVAWAKGDENHGV